jgi:threonine dehydrogenase-like Zn-dependent dehydrogenase
MIVDEVPDPVPQFGQVLVRTVACGICGSDLHFVKHGHKMIELSQDTGLPAQIDLGKDVFMGHEFCSEVLDFGPDTTGPKPGTLVVSIPAMLGMNGIQQLVYTNDFPAGYSERMLLSAPMLIEVPNGLEPAHAAMTEPMAVGIHAVNRSNVKQGEAALVLGCGPVGLAVIAALKIKGISPIVAADFSPRRRQLALTMGAHAAVDPNEEPAIEAWRRVDGSKVLVIYEAVGVPGMIHGAMRDAPAGSRILVVGVCMEGDTIQPIFGINKELNIQFVLGYDPMEFAGSLRSIAEGEIDVGPMITGHVDIEGVPGAFDDLAHPDAHAKIVVEPSV